MGPSYRKYYELIQDTFHVQFLNDQSVFDDYCAWFFRITEYMETLTDIAPELADTRALSYAAEVLTNLYFMSHQGTLVIRHVGKEIYT